MKRHACLGGASILAAALSLGTSTTVYADELEKKEIEKKNVEIKKKVIREKKILE